MIRCYYTKETIDRVSKSGRYRAIGCGGFWYGCVVLVLVTIMRDNPALLFVFPDVLFVFGCIVFWCGGGYFFHRLLCNIEKTTQEHAGDEITLDDNEIRLIKADETQISLSRKGLRVQGGYYAAGSVIYRIWNPNFSKDIIVLTSHMENAKELVEAIRPGSWDSGD